jgi:hypothetical protein
MKRLMILVALAATTFFAVVGTAGANPPSKFTFGAGGTAPACNGDTLTFSVEGDGMVMQNAGVFLVKEHGSGTGADLTTGELFDTTFDLVGTSAQDGSGSFTGHVLIKWVGHASQETFVVHSVANVNFRPDNGPVIVEIQFENCAGSGSQGL